MFVRDGVTAVACTPHILPGVYANTGDQIRTAVAALQLALDTAGVDLKLVTGCDAHVTPNFVQGLRSGHLLTLGGSRYVLVEPTHNVAPPRLEALFFDILVSGYVPILTHPERLAWIEGHYDRITSLAAAGVLMQLTASSLIGDFGRSPLYWSERMLDEGIVHFLATDAHNIAHRPPNLARGRDAAARRTNEQEAIMLVATRPAAVLADKPRDALPMPATFSGVSVVRGSSNVANPSRESAYSQQAQDGAAKPPRDRVKPDTFVGWLRRLFD